MPTSPSMDSSVRSWPDTPRPPDGASAWGPGDGRTVVGGRCGSTYGRPRWLRTDRTEWPAGARAAGEFTQVVPQRRHRHPGAAGRKPAPDAGPVHTGVPGRALGHTPNRLDTWARRGVTGQPAWVAENGRVGLAGPPHAVEDGVRLLIDEPREPQARTPRCASQSGASRPVLDIRARGHPTVDHGRCTDHGCRCRNLAALPAGWAVMSGDTASSGTLTPPGCRRKAFGVVPGWRTLRSGLTLHGGEVS